MNQTNIFIGDIIKGVMSERQVSKAELARRLGIRPQSVEYLLKRKSIDTDTLYGVSVALDYDFSKFYSLNKDQINSDKTNLDNSISKAKVVVELELGTEDLLKLDVQKKIRKALGLK